MSRIRISPFAGKRDNVRTMRSKRSILYKRQGGECAYCGILTVLPKRNIEYNPMPANLATVEHVYGRYDIRRAISKKSVLCCFKCNSEKAQKEMAEIMAFNYHLDYHIDLKQFLV